MGLRSRNNSLPHSNKFLARAKRNDRLAAWLINIGGLLVVISVVGILLLILKVAAPLFFSPDATNISTVSLSGSAPAGKILAIGTDENLKTGFIIDENGKITFFDTRTGAVSDTISLSAPGNTNQGITAITAAPDRHFDILWKDGSFSAVNINLNENSDGQTKGQPAHAIETLLEDKRVEAAPVPLLSLARFADKGSPARIDLLPGNRFVFSKITTATDLMGNETTTNVRTPFASSITGNITALVLDSKAEYLYAGTDTGRLLRWSLSDAESPQLLDSVQTSDKGSPVTALNLVLGDISIAAGNADGSFSTWFPASETGLGSSKVLTRIHPLTSHGSAVTGILPSPRNKSLYSLDKSGSINVDHMTSERHLLSLKSTSPVVLFSVSPRDNGLIALNADNRISTWLISNPHPEISFRTLFAPVWYENYDKPDYVWQSSSANDDFEPKLSLTPLIFGTLKGTLYAMIFAIPLALLGAIYTSQFMGPRMKKVVKPGIEIMAAIPSVVIGFLAGLWLAPLLDKGIVSVLVSVIVIPLCIFLSILLWKKFRIKPLLSKISVGYEFLLLVPALLLGIYASHALGGILEASLFAGDFKLWLFNSFGARFDQRNSIIIAFALGLAVIPLIFTMADDALSNVPKNLSAASLAIGASRWQTAWRVVLPSALPGIFSAVMIGFGRAIGETMIVLMATGNTPIMNWSIFNGFRSLSANIAVEIPEAPVFGTLYRVLFLSAVLLFIFTFIINTVAEVLRQNFRKKYGRF
ncbi:MAG: ABC transporter permease subunit [Geobacteraceae bacterium]|nr:ABC transporter permease subunit [Geobacteraceae bacterium]